MKKAKALAEDESLKIVYVDVQKCRNKVDFCERFSAAVLMQTSSKVEEWVDNAKSFLGRFSFLLNAAADPSSEMAIRLQMSLKERSVEDILQLPERIAQKKDIRIVVCIDEFQQVGLYPDALQFQVEMRSVWYWVKYIVGKFGSEGKSITKKQALWICTQVDGHSSYVQQLSWYVFQRTDSKVTTNILNEALQELVDQCSDIFESKIEGLTTYQMNFLRALSDGITSGLTSASVLSDYHLGSSANVSIVKKSLFEKDLITIEDKQVRLSDPIMGLWLRK